MLPGFGWSASDLATACVIIAHIVKAFDGVKGANKQYRDSHAFLCSLHQIISYIHDGDKSSSLPDNAALQIKTISDAYGDLYAYVIKYTKIDEREKSRLKTILPTVRWAMGELNHKVQHMKTNCLNAIAIMETLIVMDLSSKMNNLLHINSNQEHSLEMTSQILNDVQQQLNQLSQVSEDYQIILTDVNIVGNEQSVDLKAIQKHLECLQQSQVQLQEELAALVDHLEAHRPDDDQARAEEWKKVLELHQQNVGAQRNEAPMKQEIGQTKDLIGGAGELTNNAQLKDAGTRLQGLERVYGALVPVSGKLGKLWNSPKSTSVDGSTVSSPPQPRQYKPVPSVTMPPPPRRQYKPAPPVTTPPPPRRILPSAYQAHKSSQDIAFDVLPSQRVTPESMTSRSPPMNITAQSTFKIPSRTARSPHESPNSNVAQKQSQLYVNKHEEKGPPLPPRPSRASIQLTSSLVTPANITSSSAPPLPPRRSPNTMTAITKIGSAPSYFPMVNVNLQTVSETRSLESSKSAISTIDLVDPATPPATASPVFAVKELHATDLVQPAPVSTKSPPPPTSPKPLYLKQLMNNLKSKQIK